MNTRNSNRKLPILWVLENAELASVALSAGLATAAGVGMGAVGAVGGPSPPASFASCASQILTSASPFHICPRERLVEAFVRQEVISHVLLSWPSMLL